MELLAFNHPRVLAAGDAPFDGIAVDLERAGKQLRQDGFDTAISSETVADLRRVRQSVGGHLICRINAVGRESAAEIDAVIDAAADEILIPMVRSAGEIEAVLEHAAGRVDVSAMIETRGAVEAAPAIAGLPVRRVYVGLNDLWIDRRTPHRFDALIDGTVESLAETFDAIDFGVAGLTHPGAGRPLPCQHLINELVRLRCDFTFLRRSFYEATHNAEVRDVVLDIRAAIASAKRRTDDEVTTDRASLVRAVQALAPELDATAS